MKKNRSSFIALLFASTLFTACAGSRDAAPEANDGMADTPCTECGPQGEIELKITDEKFYREWHPEAFARQALVFFEVREGDTE